MRPITAVFVLLLSACTDQGGYYLEVKGAALKPIEGAQEILPLEVDIQVAERFVQIGFGLNNGQRFQSTEFLTPRLRTSQAAPLIRLVKQYNNFEGERVAAAIERLRGRVSGVEFGREGSPVVYIELPFWTHQREETRPGAAQSRISDAETEKMVSELKAIFVNDLKADEFVVKRNRVRIWWD